MGALKASLIGISIGLSSWMSAWSQTFTYPGCSNLAATEFQNTELAARKGLQEPVAFDLQGIWNAAGDSVTQVNIFFAERLGKVKFYDGATQAVTLAGTIPVIADSPLKMGSDDNGLMGIAVDPKFQINRWIYIWYSPTQPDTLTNLRLRLSRFTITAQNTMNMASEKILIDILTSKGDHRHAGGPMTFDASGDLWVTLGQSGNDIDWPTPGTQFSTTDSALSQEWGPSNTASLRGGIFRIHPDENATTQRKDRSGTYGPGYTIPAGNFGEYWSGQFQGQGKAALASQYRDPAKVLPEVYIKGNRSPHSIGVHPTRKWLTWGEVNPGGGGDEINLFANPVFGGMPYFYGNQTVISYPGTPKSAAAPTNTSPMNSGVTELPPAMPGALVGNATDAQGKYLLGNVAMSGPFYVYNHGLKNRDKLPPHLHNHFFHLSFATQNLWVNTLDTVAVKISRTDQVDKTLMRVPLRSPLAARIGPDGALYVLNYDGFYSTGVPAVERMGYTGSCWFYSPVSIAGSSRHSDLGVHWTHRGLTVEGDHQISAHDLTGRLLFQTQGQGRKAYSFQDLKARFNLKDGVALMRVKTERGEITEKTVY